MSGRSRAPPGAILDLITNARLPRPARPGEEAEVATGKAEATTGISYLELVASRFCGPEK